MSMFGRGLVLVLAIIIGAVASAVTVAIWMGGAGVVEIGNALRLEMTVDGAENVRRATAAGVGVFAVAVLLAGALAAFARQRTVTLWMDDQRAVAVPADSIERYLQTTVGDLKDVERVRVNTSAADDRRTAIAVDLVVAPDADASTITAGVEGRVDSALVTSWRILLDQRPSITLHHARRGRSSSDREAA